MYKTAKFLFLLILIVGCVTDGNPIKLISPADHLKLSNTSPYISDNPAQTEVLNKIEAFIKIKGFQYIATNNGIYILDNHKIIKQYNFHFKKHNLELLSVKFIPNSDYSKLLFTVSTGQSSPSLLSQIDLNTFNLDWINEYSKQITSVSYANNSDYIAVATGSHKENKTLPEYYSSLFILKGNDGKFIDYFRQGESVSKLEFSDNDQLLFAVLDWPHTDTYVWNINEKQKRIGSYGKASNRYYDVNSLNEQAFISIGANGISKWDLSNQDTYTLVYNKELNPANKIFKTSNQKEYILLDYLKGMSNNPTIRYFNPNFKLVDSFHLKTNFTNIVKSEYMLNGIDTNNNSIITFDIAKKAVNSNIRIDSLFANANTIHTHKK